MTFKYVGVIPADIIDSLQVINKAPQSAVIAVRDEDIWHAIRDLKKGKTTMLLNYWLSNQHLALSHPP